MNRYLLCVLGSLAAACSSSGSTEWSYAGATGPSHWGDLKPEYAIAKTGQHQSPIDIVPAAATRKDAPALKFDYVATTLEVLNNGHTVEDDYHGGGTLTVDGHVYKLAQFHFHSPSEHTIGGRHAPMEMHLVHKDEGGKLAVVGVLIEEGAAHPELARIWQRMPREIGRSAPVPGETVNAANLLPNDRSSFRYSGSLTTPPCSEGVAWFVLQQPIVASREQIAEFQKVISGNNRPTQPLHGRSVMAVK
jgi:carbonic anhydrase